MSKTNKTPREPEQTEMLPETVPHGQANTPLMGVVPGFVSILCPVCRGTGRIVSLVEARDGTAYFEPTIDCNACKGRGTISGIPVGPDKPACVNGFDLTSGSVYVQIRGPNGRPAWGLMFRKGVLNPAAIVHNAC